MLLGLADYRGQLWDPSQLTHPPTAWYNETSGITNTGTSLNTWDDISGNGYTQTTTAGSPQIQTLGLNSKRTINFTTCAMACQTVGGQSLFQNIPSAWGLILYNTSDSGSATKVLIYASTNAVNSARFSYASSNTAPIIPALRVKRLDTDTIAALQYISGISGWHSVLVTMDYQGRTGTFYEDGTQVAQNTTLTTAGNTSNTASIEGFGLGGTAGGNAETNSVIAEVVLGVGNLPTASEIDKLFGWLLWKWGLNAQLPPTSPYFSHPP